MAKLCLVFSSNLFHGELNRKRYKRLIKDGELLRILRAINMIPCSLSVEGFDMELLPELKDFVENEASLAEVIRSEWAHTFLDWLEMGDPELAIFNLRHDTQRPYHPVGFLSEYSTVPNKTAHIFGGAKPAFYVLDTQTNMYSDNYAPDAPIKLLNEFKELECTHAIEHAGIIYLRMYMKYFQAVSGKWFGFQRFHNSNHENHVSIETLIQTFKEQLEEADKDGVPIVFFPMDIESCLIGSHHGAIIYEEIAQALQESDLPLIGPREAYNILAPQAIKSQRPHRFMNDKWDGYESQRRFRNKIILQMHDLAKISLTDNDKKILLIAAISDGFVVQKFKHCKRVRLPSDGDDLIFGGENVDALAVQMAAFDHFSQNKTFLYSMKALHEQHPESVLFRLVREWAEKIG